MDLKIVEKLFLLLVKSQIRQWDYVLASNEKLLDRFEHDRESRELYEELKDKVKYLEDRIKA